jgi:hypothetical protein
MLEFNFTGAPVSNVCQIASTQPHAASRPTDPLHIPAIRVQADPIAQHQGIENALSMAAYYTSRGQSDKALARLRQATGLFRSNLQGSAS